jgi:hypothetical protein
MVGLEEPRTRSMDFLPFSLACVLALLLVTALACGGEGEPETTSQVEGVTRADALRLAISLPEGPERVVALAAALGDLDPESARLLADVFLESSDGIPTYELRALYMGWTEIEPFAGLSHLFTQPVDAQRDALIGALVRRLAMIDPVRAQVFVLEMPEEDAEHMQETLMLSLVQGWVAGGNDLAPIARFMEQAPKGWNRERATRLIMDAVLERGTHQDAMEWAESITEGQSDNYRAVAFRKVALVLGEEFPLEVAAWLDGHREHRYGQAGLRVLSRVWGEVDPNAALEWALSQPDDRGRWLSIKFAFDSWVQEDEAAARAWLEARPDDPIMDPAYLMLALRTGPKTPRSAADAALRIHDERSRNDTVTRVVGPWFGKDQAAAQDWLDANQISAAVQERVRAEAIAMTPQRLVRPQARDDDGAGTP